MTTNKIFDEIFTGDHSERAVAFKNNIKSAVASYTANPSNIAHIRYLNSQYWDMVYFIIKKKILTTGTLEFSDSEKIAIDFGYISDELLNENGDISSVILDENKPVNKHDSLPVICFSISAWLFEQLQDFMGINKIKEYEKRYEALVASVNNLREEKLIVIESKAKLNKDFCGNPPKGLSKSDIDKIIDYNEKIEKALEKYGLLRSQIQNELLLKKNERVEFVTLENLINNTREERKKFCKTFVKINPDYLSKLVFLEDMIIQKEHEIFDNVTLIGKSRQKIEEFIYSKKEILDEEKDGFLKDRISAIKNIIDLISKNNKVEPIIFLTRHLDKNIAGKVFEIMDKAVVSDPGLFENKKVRIYGHPDVILVPGRGRGDYDYHMNAFIIPQFPQKDYSDSILNALALYRWQCDEESRVKNSFAFLKLNKYFTSASTLMQSFIKNYCIYMSKSIAGEDVEEINDFDCETLWWFNSFISRKESEPSAAIKDETKAPVEVKTEDNKLIAHEQKTIDAANISQKTEAVKESAAEPKETEKDGKDDEKDKVKAVEKLSENLNSGQEPEGKNAQQGVIKGQASAKTTPAMPRKPIKLPGEFIIEEREDEKSENKNAEVEHKPKNSETSELSTQNNRNDNIIEKDEPKNNTKKNEPEYEESEVSKEVNETISMLLKENSTIIKKRIQSIFKFEDITVEPAKDHQKVNITLRNLDAGQIKHFLNLMSLQSKYYKFMSSIIKDEE